MNGEVWIYRYRDQNAAMLFGESGKASLSWIGTLELPKAPRRRWLILSRTMVFLNVRVRVAFRGMSQILMKILNLWGVFLCPWLELHSNYQNIVGSKVVPQ
jgi:hypothetical protein